MNVLLLRPLLLLFLLLFVFGIPQAATVYTTGADDIELSFHLGVMQLGQADDWVNCDTLIAPTSALLPDEDTIQLFSYPFDTIESTLQAMPCFLSCLHARNFVTIYPEQQAAFSVEYSDPYGNNPSAGYPRLTLWQTGSSETLSYPLTSSAATIYNKTLLLPPGEYWYRYSVRNEYIADEYILEAGSFTVTRRPTVVENTGVQEETVVCNARVPLRWDSSDPGGGQLRYKLYFGSSPDTLAVLYEGNNTSFDLTGLSNDSRYYWQVEAINPYGASSKSTVFSFTTVAAITKSFNYPNPFNPATGQSTKLVFTMPAAGRAEIAILTELGDLCWQHTFDNLLSGVNEISFNGKDDRGNTLYNGTYVCLIRKHFNNRKETDKCRILVIK